MKKTEILKENRRFKYLYSKGKTAVFPLFILYFKENKLSKNRIGITVSKKIGGAVVRNRAKRVIREAYRLLQEDICSGYDFVFVARTRTAQVPMNAVKSQLYKAMKKNRLLKDL